MKIYANFARGGAYLMFVIVLGTKSFKVLYVLMFVSPLDFPIYFSLHKVYAFQPAQLKPMVIILVAYAHGGGVWGGECPLI